MEQDSPVLSSVPGSESELGTRIDIAATSLGSRKNAAFAMGVSTDQLARYLRNENEPPVGAVVRLGKASGYSVAWLADGEGPMLLADLNPLTPAGALDIARMRLAIEAVEEGLEAAKRTMAPAKKADLVLAVYDLLDDATEASKGKVLKLVKLAA